MSRIDKLINSGKIAELAMYLKNIRLVTFTATGLRNKEDSKSKVTVQKVTLAINTELDDIWQIECHLITTYKFEKIVHLQIDDKGF